MGVASMRDEATTVTTEGSRWLAEVVVVPKEGVNDPEGEAILGGLHSLGYRLVERVTAGRLLEVALQATDAEAARDAATSMCERLLANPVIESYRVTVRQLSNAGEPIEAGA